ncbi:MAG: phenylalanine--tRNA ligase subunit beta, partial [Oscillospiraceae bacterium]|nr:phenylalanine--tRNA ligase subunit beta [Oscillospiraceae bacterium]
ARLDCNTLFAVRSGDKEYHPLPKFPATTRDLALLCDDDLPVQSIEKAIRAGAGKLLEKTELFDIYKGKQIPEGKKSVAYNITMRSADRTLTDEDVEKAMNKILKNLADLGASIRG